MEGWKHDLRNTWWVIDYNRQSLDAVAHENLYGQLDKLFRSMGWEVVTIKYGHLQEAAFRETGGAALLAVFDACPNQLDWALPYPGGAAVPTRHINYIAHKSREGKERVHTWM